MDNIINVIKDHWQIMLGLFFIIRIVEIIIKFILKKVFGIVAKPLGVVKKVSLFEWVLILLLAGSLAAIIYLTM